MKLSELNEVLIKALIPVPFILRNDLVIMPERSSLHNGNGWRKALLAIKLAPTPI